MAVIIIAGNLAEFERYRHAHGIRPQDAAFGQAALGCHYERLILAGSWFVLPDIRERVSRALVSVWRPTKWAPTAAPKETTDQEFNRRMDECLKIAMTPPPLPGVIDIHPYDLAEMIQRMNTQEYLETWLRSDRLGLPQRVYLIGDVVYRQNPTTPRTPGEHTIE